MKRQRIINPTAKNDGVLEIDIERERERERGGPVERGFESQRES